MFGGGRFGPLVKWVIEKEIPLVQKENLLKKDFIFSMCDTELSLIIILLLLLFMIPPERYWKVPPV